MVATLNRRHLFSATAAFGLATTTGLISLPAKAASIKSSGTVDMEKLLAPAKAKDMIEGDVNAPVTIVEYASLTCSHCADFYKNTLPEIREKYIKTGKARLIFRDFPFDPRATAGFMLARCLPEDRFFPMVHVLFEQQMEWAAANDALPPLRKIASMAGLDDKAFNACLENQTILDQVNSSFERGKELGVTATPTFFINGNKYEGALSVEEMSTIIDSFL
ncbi:DsbA family protein [Bartonella tamiae]|uniref:Thioredoxin domain-containing protein n=1 Tax=Bartonella tamiae Th239 TaxID=1094558 RepID=J0R4G8_9HYPH|nr:DsbA family protein [Bartonella tamiae]EJF90549.1 hypothetical protein ME5_00950 [Bartonella tamiae Th239]EJF94073.1 hypothetical protein MEG_00931 [Bartonella tamiae Th307]